MTDDIASALDQLSRLLPLQARQRALPDGFATVHRAILRGLASRGRAPDRAALRALLPREADLAAVLARLAADDLIVLDAERRVVLGAYPMTTEPTAHRLKLDGVSVNAMCALDALAVAPMFNSEVGVESLCHVSGTPVRVKVRGLDIVHARPVGLHVGIAWQAPCGHAAHSLCREMVFLADAAAASTWRGGDRDAKGLFALPQALDLAARFFRPLLA